MSVHTQIWARAYMNTVHLTIVGPVHPLKQLIATWLSQFLQSNQVTLNYLI